jgi:hypothetical protein
VQLQLQLQQTPQNIERNIFLGSSGQSFQKIVHYQKIFQENKSAWLTINQSVVFSTAKNS